MPNDSFQIYNGALNKNAPITLDYASKLQNQIDNINSDFEFKLGMDALVNSDAQKLKLAIDEQKIQDNFTKLKKNFGNGGNGGNGDENPFKLSNLFKNGYFNNAMSFADQLLNNPNDSALTTGINKGMDAIGDAIPAAQPYIKAASVVGKGLNMLSSTDQQTTFDKIGDSAIGKLTGVGMVNSLFGSKTHDFYVDSNALEQIGGSYGGTSENISLASEKANKKYGLFSSGSRKEANSFIDETQGQMSAMTNIAKEASDRKAMMSDLNHIRYAQQLNGGLGDMRMAKQGAKLKRIKKIDFHKQGSIIKAPLDVWSPTIDLYQPNINVYKEGGKTEKPEEALQKSVIPEGALHARKHHMEDDKNITKKGIPVIDNDGNQQAEIERNEIIFSLPITKEIEERYKEFYQEGTTNKRKDELALEAGKILCEEILNNTDDRTGLINSLKQGGVLFAKDGTEVKPKYKDWVKDVNPEYINPNYDLEMAYQYLPFEQMERWKKAVNSADPNTYMNYQDPKTGEHTYHLKSVVKLNNGDYVFLKKGKLEDNPELKGELDYYNSNKDGIKDSHDLVYEGDRYYYRKKHQDGGSIIDPEDNDFSTWSPINAKVKGKTKTVNDTIQSFYITDYGDGRIAYSQKILSPDNELDRIIISTPNNKNGFKYFMNSINNGKLTEEYLKELPQEIIDLLNNG